MNIYIAICAVTFNAAALLASSHAQTPYQHAPQSMLSAETSDCIEGFTEPYRDIQLGSADTGTIREIRVEEGKAVQFGQVVAKLDDRLYQESVLVARLAASATGELEAAQSQLENTQRRLDQMSSLHERNHASEQELLNVRAARDEALARVKAYQELHARRQQELKQSEAQLSRMTITSPIDGVVVKCLKDVGEIVSPADPALLRIVQLDPLRISATATIEQTRRLRVGQTLRVSINGVQKPAVLEFVSPVADISSGTTQVQFRVANSDHTLLAGMPCQIELPTEPDPSKSLPRQTLNPQFKERFK